MAHPKAFELAPTVQSYAWGKKGRSSLVAQVIAHHGTEIDETMPYAELWMGTHPNGPNKVKHTDGQYLSERIKADVSLIGDAVSSQFSGELPFLFKILSVGQSLSIQAHPDARLAKQLHSAQPKNYPDANHKPELAIALTEFSGMCGFRSLSELSHFVQSVPELAAVLGDAASVVVSASKTHADDDTTPTAIAARVSAIRCAFRALMTADQSLVCANVSLLQSRLSAASEAPSRGSADAWFLRLCVDYPGDVGCLAVYVLNVVTLAAGQGMFMAANEPHAYLDGDCIECMACSDNVVRAGLTPKFKDVNTLIDMLTYRHGPESRSLVEGAPSRSDPAHVFEYEPPVAEFAVHSARVPRGERATLSAVDGPSIVLVVSGSGTLSVEEAKSEIDFAIEKGSVLFIGANRSACIRASEASAETVVAFRAHCRPSVS